MLHVYTEKQNCLSTTKPNKNPLSQYLHKWPFSPQVGQVSAALKGNGRNSWNDLQGHSRSTAITRFTYIIQWCTV